MNAGDVMTRPAVTLRQGASLAEAVGLMLGSGISGLPVVDEGGRLVGVLTEGDLLRRIEVGTGERHRSAWWTFLRGPGLNADEYVRSHSRRVADLMTRDPVTATEGTPLDRVVELMERKRIKRLPVVRGEEVVGVVGRADLLRALRAALGAVRDGRADDAAVLERLRVELGAQSWFSARNISIGVKDGVVALEGIVGDERTRAALRVAAQNASGTDEVRDGLVVVDPATGMVLSPV